MPITRHDETELLTSLHEGMFEEPLWNSYLLRLRLRIQADHCSFFLRREVAELAGSLELFCSREGLDVRRHNHVKDLYRLDAATYEAMRPGRVYNLTELVASANVAHNNFLRGEIAPHGMSFARIVRITEPDGCSAWLSIWRSDEDFGASEGSLLNALAPHMAIALRTFSTISGLSERAGEDKTPDSQWDIGQLELDAKGRVVHLSEAAQHLLWRSTVFRRIKHGRLMPAAQQANRALNTTLRNFALDPEVSPCTIHLADDPWLDMLLIPMKSRMSNDPAAPVAKIHIYGDTEPTALRIDQLIEIFGLSRSEARLAIGIARGQSITEAGDAMGVTHQTARFYSKRIYEKTGARGQMEVARTLNACLAIAPAFRRSKEPVAQASAVRHL